MNIFETLKALVVAITAAIISLIGLGTPPAEIPNPGPTIQAVDSIVLDQASTTPSPTSGQVTDAYELGKAVGRLEQQVVALGNATTSSTTTTPIQTIVPTQPVTAQPQPTIQTKPSMKDLEIISRTPNGFNRTYKANNYKLNPDGTLAEGSIAQDENNYIDFGVIVRDDNGNPVKDAVVQVRVTDASQNKTLNGTGDIVNIYPNGVKTQVPYYHFRYEFRTAGRHEVAFESNGMISTKPFEVTE